MTTTETDVTVTKETLDATPERVLVFLRAIGTREVIRSAMLGYGYDGAEHRRGWTLLHAASGYREEAAPSNAADVEVAAAVTELDAWDERGFRVARAALKTRHPAQHQFVFNGLVASQGASAVIGVQAFLDRLDALESGEDRKATRKEDRAALATLAARSITESERTRLRALVHVAQRFARTDGAAPTPAALESAEAHHAALVDLRAYFEEWSEIARTAITRRDHLIFMGLAKRKKPSKKSAPGADKTAQPG